jgi:hypothetical protein
VGTLFVATGLGLAAYGVNLVTFLGSALTFGIGLAFSSIALTSLAAALVELRDKPLAMATFSAGFDGGIMVGSFFVAAMLLFELDLALSLALTSISAALAFLCSFCMRRTLEKRLEQLQEK